MSVYPRETEKKIVEPSEAEIKEQVQLMKQHFQTGATWEYQHRRKQLKKLLQLIKDHETELLSATYQDLHKPPFEAYAGELAIVLEEIRYILRRLKKWMKAKPVKVKLAHFPTRARYRYVPKGVVLIIGAWNYPLQLILSPLVGALAAGNCVILKPSEVAPHSSHLLKQLIAEYFDKREVTVMEGGANVVQNLIKMDLDHIFFTGGTRVGKIILRSAAEYFTPVTLELGGKNPALVDKKVNLKVAAKRIVFGKFFNAGQTCVAPDYVLVPRELQSRLVQELKQNILSMYSSTPSQSPDYARIINSIHLSRLQQLLASIPAENIAFGGEINEKDLYISPTILENVPLNHEIMKEEIFGPLLPLIPYDSWEEAITIIRTFPPPLVAYLFSNDKSRIKQFREQTRSGSIGVNDTLIHFTLPEFPIGGMKQSGLGYYHGKRSFEVFSYQRGEFEKATWLDLPFRYAPYSKFKTRLMKWFFK